MGSVISESGRAEFRRCLAGRSNLSFGWKEADSSAALRNGSQKSKSKARSELLFRFGGISWIIDEDERVPDRLAIPFQFRNTGCRDLNPASRRVMWGRSTSSLKQAACQPRWLATLERKLLCARSLHCNVRIVRIGTIRPRRTRRQPRLGWSSPSFAIPAGSTRRIKRPSSFWFSVVSSQLSVKTFRTEN